MKPESIDTPNVPVVLVKDGHAVADSRDVATAFGKQHKDVLRKIDALLIEVPELGLRNFTPTPYVEASNGQQYRAFEMDRKAFSLLAMRFTGVKALQWQLAYIDQFDRMEKAIHSGGGALELTSESRGVIGGIVKGVVHKEIETLLPALIRSEILSGTYHVVEGVSALEVAEMAGYPAGKRPRGASQFISRRLGRYHEDRGQPVRRSRHGSGKVRLFDEVTARRWLSAGGNTEIDQYITQRRGQGKLKLVRL